jgi:c-di-GMP phosphodiesterase
MNKIIKNNLDEIILILFIATISPILINLNLFEVIYEITRSNEEYEFDELFIVFISILLGLSLYSFKKFKDLEKTRKEIITINETDSLTKLKNRNAFLTHDEVSINMLFY